MTFTCLFYYATFTYHYDTIVHAAFHAASTSLDCLDELRCTTCPQAALYIVFKQDGAEFYELSLTVTM